MVDVSWGRLRSIVKYDAETGVFTYIVNRGRQRKVGDVAGFISKNGYRIIPVRDGALRRDYAAHRLAWFYVHGAWPRNQVDHINGVRDDNRIANLREATRSQNLANRGAQVNNTSGLKGVSFHKKSGKWRGDIQVGGKGMFLGLHDTADGAAAAYDLAAYLHFGAFSKATVLSPNP